MVIRSPTPADVEAVLDLFAAIDWGSFHPHARDLATAEWVASYAGRDVYLLGWEGAEAVAYGLLRGWDEGYETPRLGIATRPAFEGQGHGRAMMRALTHAARERGANRIALRVSHANERAHRFYELSGFRDVGEERAERLMVLDL